MKHRTARRFARYAANTGVDYINFKNGSYVVFNYGHDIIDVVLYDKNDRLLDLYKICIIRKEKTNSKFNLWLLKLANHKTQSEIKTEKALSGLQQETIDMVEKYNLPLNILSLTDSVKKDYQDGIITLQEAAVEFYEAGYTRWIDTEYTAKQLNK